MQFLIAYVLIVSIIGFIVMGVDKGKARKHLWRISERTMFLIALVGGAAGILSGMIFFRHKTKHMSFVLGIPVLVLANFWAVQFLLKR